jgi:hypothetical protein
MTAARRHWSDNYPWYEHHRCCDQLYAKDEDEWTPEELADLKTELLGPTGESDLPWDVPLSLYGHEVGSIRIDLKRVFDGVVEELRYSRTAADGDPHRRLTDAEFDAPVTETELAAAVATVAKIANELWYESDLPEELHREVETVLPAVDAGPQETINLLRRMRSIEDIRSRRLLRAVSAIASANEWQGEPDSLRKRELMQKRPECFQPMPVTTQNLARQILRLVARRGLNGCRPIGRPRETNHAQLRERFFAARSVLGPFHRRAMEFQCDVGRGRAILAREFPDVTSRLRNQGLFDEWFRSSPFDLALEEMAAELVALEHVPRLSPATVRRYARSRALNPG